MQITGTQKKRREEEFIFISLSTHYQRTTEIK